ncbi:Uronate isomerase [Sulfitobacter noctilucicola]|uniref:Uronate isomerase n=1 Tax=Sulfitobacter noctilucicola TaxID=1342301 RepID=A0A7W6M5P3_9RHOB|nr:glucuronate isomerase [Sulfitobacter noctilucicola]KIN62907.1 Uronate isomerase [Sulfitobacter noctilucicola]MBB4172563.1 glucuronate isomerase [Sulfitobacter noctilucicola]
MPLTDPDRLFPVNEKQRDLARALYATVSGLPIVSPHGHCDPRWFAENARFPNPAELFVIPDHYVFRMLVSQGMPLADLGIPRVDGSPVEADPRKIWHRFASAFSLFRGTPSSLWLEHAFEHTFGIDEVLNAESANAIYDSIEGQLATEAFRPRALFDRFNIETLATTEGPLDDLKWHQMIKDSDWSGKVITTYRPDAVVDPDFDGFAENVATFGALTQQDTSTWSGYLEAHRLRRDYFKKHGATATDHGHPSAATENLDAATAADLFQTILSGAFTPRQAEVFRGQMLTEMAKMSLEDGLTLQIHAGSRRNHSAGVLAQFGRDKGFDIPGRTDYVQALKPLLDAVGMDPNLTVILFTLDETVYARELAPLAGVYPALKLGPPWWFYDSFEGIKRFREATTETCGFYNTAGFNDDTRAFCSIPARHDVSRRSDCAYLSTLVTTGRLREAEAFEVAHDLAYGLAKTAYNL